MSTSDAMYDMSRGKNKHENWNLIPMQKSWDFLKTVGRKYQQLESGKQSARWDKMVWKSFREKFEQWYSRKEKKWKTEKSRIKEIKI